MRSPRWARARGIFVIAVVNPTSLALLKPPGEWDTGGADIVVGEGQPLGVPLSSGGPYFGFMTTRMAHVRQMPGRIVGRTVDVSGRDGFTLTLQAREQHIRRARATSNICTNQGLLVTAATIYMSLMGPQGLARVASASHARTAELVAALTRVPGVRRLVLGRLLSRGGACARPARWRRCCSGSRIVAFSAASICPSTIRSSAMRCWFAPRRPRRARTSSAMRARSTEIMKAARAA